MNKEESYIYGLLITDGSLSLYDRNRGKVSLEVNRIDEDIVYKLCNLIPNSLIENELEIQILKKITLLKSSLILGKSFEIN